MIVNMKLNNLKKKIILRYLKKEWGITKEEYAGDDENLLNIYEEDSKAWNLLIFILKGISFGLVRQ